MDSTVKALDLWKGCKIPLNGDSNGYKEETYVWYWCEVDEAIWPHV